MAAQIIEFGKDEAINPGATSVINLSLVDGDGVAIDVAAVTAITVTLINLTTGKVINNRNGQNAFNAGMGAMVANTLTLSLTAADTVLVPVQARKHQQRLLSITVTFTTGVAVLGVYFWVRDMVVVN